MKRNINAQKILQDIKKNNKKLDSCNVHQFEGGDPLPFGMKYKCKKCGGEMKGTDVLWYITGYEAAGGNADDIYPNWHGVKAND
ncbi:TPA: hypothetical protein ACX3EJ_001026 [Vibrio parahaemolyticus]|uniref:hypothetical protein n=1 Tax=Vibrio parahaemolyticus TaxID=670 RepID=UPI000A3AA2D3|nr:hypothetical protein [Vibrio parahaemolyticus]OUJ46340.1 hypothetical protein BTZ53_11020 [Vibrio parahaemolyticus]HCG6030271.1 hypothetical protein [Vibrio parahaemolyticus]HDF8527408.1 hypothetical protein [Vibrio parahaemolyticus]